MCYTSPSKMSNLQDIQKRAVKARRQFDHVAWYGICRRCGLTRYVLGKDMYDENKDYTRDLRGEEVECSSPRCTAKVKIHGKVPESRAVHFADIARRGEK